MTYKLFSMQREMPANSLNGCKNILVDLKVIFVPDKLHFLFSVHSFFFTEYLVIEEWFFLLGQQECMIETKKQERMKSESNTI